MISLLLRRNRMKRGETGVSTGSDTRAGDPVSARRGGWEASTSIGLGDRLVDDDEAGESDSEEDEDDDDDEEDDEEEDERHGLIHGSAGSSSTKERDASTSRLCRRGRGSSHAGPSTPKDLHAC